MPERTISHYRTVRRLGAGGMAEVYLARDTQLDRPIALKVLSAELSKDPNQHKRFRTEAKAASRLNHPHICVIHEVGETEDGRPFLAMEYVEGRTLDVVLKHRRLKVREAIKVGIEVAEALAAAHAHGLVHRDIKPANIMLERRGEVKVLDFGLAKRLPTEELTAATASAAHTRTGMLIGTPQYMSPEQALGHPLDPRTDIFSLGVVLYELVAGQRPFLGKTLGETINSIVNQSPAPIGQENPDCPPALEEIIFKCLQKDREARYSSANALVADLLRLKENLDRSLGDMIPEPSPELLDPLPEAPPPTALWRLATDAGARSVAVRVWLTLVILALLGLGGWALLHNRATKQPVPTTQLETPVAPKSVAVLPFVNLSADKADDYIGDGVSDEIITALSQIKGLKVPARTSCFSFKGRNENIRKIGQQLHVSAVLEGSVSRSGDRVRITAQLINIADGFPIWSETYDRSLDSLLVIRAEVAAQVAAALKGELLGEERQQLAKRGTDSAEAHRLYLRGRYLWNRRTPKDMQESIDCFNQALGKDPGYALAYAGLADCYFVLPAFTERPRAQAEVLPKARDAAQRALELDSTLAEPHATLAGTKALLDWDWSGAEAEYRRAIALNPNYATAHHWFANTLSTLGRRKEALAEEQLAYELDPLSRFIEANLALSLFDNGKPDQAINLLRRQIAEDPGLRVAHVFLADIYGFQGKFSEAIAELESIQHLDVSGSARSARLGWLYARAGQTAEAQKILDKMLELQKQGSDYRVHIALTQHALGDNESALDSLELALTERAAALETLNNGPEWEKLRPHPRVQAILRQMNLVK